MAAFTPFFKEKTRGTEFGKSRSIILVTTLHRHYEAGLRQGDF